MKLAHVVRLLILFLTTIQAGFAQGDTKQNGHPDSPRAESPMMAQSAGQTGTVANGMKMDGMQPMAPMPAPLADYPTYHPMVVHAPIILLLMAALLQLVVLVKPSSPLHWLTLLMAAGGTVGAYVAGSFVHPHTTGLSHAAQLALKTHETYADYTLWLGLTGTLLKGTTLWRPLKWVEGMAAVALVGAGIAVGLAGHQGGALTYQYGIGPRGAYLMQHGEGDHADGDRDEHNQSPNAK